MKKMPIVLLSVLLLIFYSTSILAQGVNASTDKSPVMTKHVFEEADLYACCPQYGCMDGKILTHYIEQTLPNGDITFHFNFNGEVTDTQGEIWTYKDAWIIRVNNDDGFYLENDHGFLFGPNGEKLKLQITIIWNRKDKLVQVIYDPMCF